MPTETHPALASDAAEIDADLRARRELIETAFAVLFAAAAIFCASLLAVVTGLD